MKKWTMLCLLCMATIVSHAQDTTYMVGDVLDKIMAVNEAAPKLHMKKAYLPGYSQQGADRQILYDQSGNVKKVICVSHTTDANTTDEYYIDEDTVFFMFRTQDLFQHTGRLESVPPTTRRVESRFYFSHGKLVRWSDGTKVVEVEKYPAKETEILALYQNVLHHKAT